MKIEVAKGIEELKRQFSSSAFNVSEDGTGGAYVVIETVPFGQRFRPDHAWLGFQIPAQYPYADIYPIFVGAELNRADGRAFADTTFKEEPPFKCPAAMEQPKTACKKLPPRYSRSWTF